uniref:Coiled-coil domain containing 28A n=1 Tax=Tetraodon nigroviridis TaxID=99883 RepID=H3C0E4_TETNG
LPVARLDLAAALPRVLSLKVMSFLNPRDLCAAAQVSWHWRFLAEQDCLWEGRCVRRGWFLPYSPGPREYGAWKSHYVACVSTLGCCRRGGRPPGTGRPRERRRTPEVEEEERTARKLRRTIRESIREEKGERKQPGAVRPASESCVSAGVSLRSRRAWGSSAAPGAAAGGRSRALGSRGPDRLPSPSRTSGALSSFVYRPPSPPHVPTVHLPPPVLLLLVSNRIPAYELLLSGLKAAVVAVLYDHRGTQSALLAQVRSAVSGRRAQRLGLLAPGGTQELHLLHDSRLSEATLPTPRHREFWEELSGWVAPPAEGGGIDIFSPLAAAAEAGVALIQALSALTGLQVQAPMGLATGSFQSSESASAGGSWASGPTVRFVSESALQGWCRQAEWMEEALEELRGLLEPRLPRLSRQIRGRALGHFLEERLRLEELGVSADLGHALTDGLAELSRVEESRPVEFLADFLRRWSQADGDRDGGGSAAPEAVGAGPEPDPQAGLEWRGLAARELQRSEEVYLQRLGAVLKAYLEPLNAALDSGRTILSSSELHLILTPVTSILELNRTFQADLEARLQHWGAEQCVGDVLMKLCSNLRVYSTYLSNYPTAVDAVDRCRESKPLFRAFLKRTDRTLSTHMLSLQELLLCPAWRIREYVTLLQALRLHTHPQHPDHTHLTSALHTLLAFRDFVRTLKRNCERDGRMEETQKMIRGCPSLGGRNRRLIMSQEAVLLRTPGEQLPDSIRIYQTVCDLGLFLFNDLLLLTRRTVRHLPFTLGRRSTHTFQASVALSSLAVRDMAHTRYVSHAFVLDAPDRSWVCATERAEERDDFLAALRAAISSALAP